LSIGDTRESRISGTVTLPPASNIFITITLVIAIAIALAMTIPVSSTC
jgi:hypothetical protein